MSKHGFQTGDRVRCDDGEEGTVIELIADLMHGAQNLLVQWDNGTNGDCDSWYLEKLLPEDARVWRRPTQSAGWCRCADIPCVCREKSR